MSKTFGMKSRADTEHIIVLDKVHHLKFYDDGYVRRLYISFANENIQMEAYKDLNPHGYKAVLEAYDTLKSALNGAEEV